MNLYDKFAINSADSTPSTKASTGAIATTMTSTYITNMVVALSTGSSIDDGASSSTAAELEQSTEAMTTMFEAIITISGILLIRP